MRRLWLAILLLGATQEPERDRSPGALVLSPDGRWALTVNRSSDSVSLVDLKERKVAAEVAVGRQPFGIDWRGSVAMVSCWRDDTVALLDVAPPKLTVAATISVGNEPRGVLLTPDA